MPGHRPFCDLIKGFSPARKARIVDTAAAVETAIAVRELRKGRAASKETLADVAEPDEPPSK